jgi:hypothetical protein
LPWRWLAVELSRILDLLPVLVPGGVATAITVQGGRIILERVRGGNRLAEIQAEREAKLADIEAMKDAEVAKIQANGLVQVQLERERSRALASSALAIDPPPG